MRVVLRTDYENSYEPRCFTPKAFIQYANELIVMNDSNETFRYSENQLNEAIDYVADTWGFTIDVFEVEGADDE